MQLFKLSKDYSKVQVKEQADDSQHTSNIDTDVPVTVQQHIQISQARWACTFTGLFLGGLFYGLDTTISADVQIPILEEFGEITNLPWVGLGFPMSAVAVILLTCQLYSFFNVRWLLLASFLIFELGSALCGAAPTFNTLIVGRVIAGIGGSGMYIGALTYVDTFQPPKGAAIYNALLGVGWGLGALLGPVIGGGFSTSSATWRWAFYINLPLAALITPLNIFVYPLHNPRPDMSIAKKFKSIDWLGAFLMIPVFVLFIVVVSFQGSRFAWKSAAVISLWVLWGLSLTAFIVQQYFKDSEHRLFPAHFLKSRSMVLIYIGTAAGSVLLCTSLFYVPLYFAFTHGDSALRAAVRLMPFVATFITTTMLSGGILSVLGRYNIFYIAGGIFALIGGSFMLRISSTTSVASIYGFEVLLAAGAGFTAQNGYAIAGAKVSSRPADKVKAVGFINVAQIGTIAIALSMSACIFQNIGFSELRNVPAFAGLSDELLRSALSGRQSPIFSNPEFRDVVAVVIHIIARTIAKVFGVTVASGGVLVLTGLLMKREVLKLDGGLAM